LPGSGCNDARVEKGLADRLAAWKADGVVDADTAARIEAFESAHPQAGEPRTGITVSEVIAYIGTVVLLVGIGFLYGTEYQALGTSGRLAILGLVAVAGLAAGELLRRMGATAAVGRARAAGWSVASIAIATWLAQAFIDADFLTQRYQYDPTGPADVSGSLMLATFIGFVIAAALLWRAGAGLLAVVTAALAYTSVGNLDSYVHPSELSWPAEITWLIPAVALAVLAETITGSPQRRWAREILRFAAVLPPVISALVFSGSPETISLEIFAGLLAVAGFGLARMRGSAGYAIGGGVGLFIVINEVGFRHFSQSVGFPVVLIVSGIALFAIAGGLVGILGRQGGRA
jgi:hypothetical protein